MLAQIIKQEYALKHIIVIYTSTFKLTVNKNGVDRTCVTYPQYNFLQRIHHSLQIEVHHCCIIKNHS